MAEREIQKENNKKKHKKTQVQVLNKKRNYRKLLWTAL
jgi:hypothetical protein